MGTRPVLTRDPRHLDLSIIGMELLAHARRPLDLYAEALTALHGPAIFGRLYLGVPDSHAFR